MQRWEKETFSKRFLVPRSRELEWNITRSIIVQKYSVS